MKRKIVVMACLAVVGGLGCGDDEDATGSGGGGGTGGQGGAPTGRVADVLALSGDATAGATVFDTCGLSNCHGPDGTASISNARDLTTHVPTATDAQIIKTVIDGSITGAAVMPPYGGQFSDQEIADVVAYLRATFP